MVNTPIYDIEMPDPNADEDAWAPILNAAIVSLETHAADKVLKIGDTMSGALAISQTAARLYLDNAAAGNNSAIIGRVAGKNRWGLYIVTAQPETGGNAGSHFALYRYADDGTTASQVLWVDRATGNIHLIESPTSGTHAARKDYVDAQRDSRVALAGDTMTGALTISYGTAALVLNAPTVGNRQLLAQTNGSNRWNIKPGSNTAETGGNAGSDFVLTRYNDAGVRIDDPLTILRNEGMLRANVGVMLPGGSAAAPTITYGGDTDTGIYRPAADQIAVTTGATQRLLVTTEAITAALPVTLPGDPTLPEHAATKGYIDGLFVGGGLTKPLADTYYVNIEGDTMTGALQMPAGTSAAPSINFAGSATTGLFLNGVNQVGVTTGGTTRMSFTSTENVSTVKLRVPVGSAAAPAINFTGDTTTGIYQGGAGILGFATTGVARLTIGTAGIASTLPVTLPDGTAALPALAFTSDPDTGVYAYGTNQIGFATGGANRLVIGVGTITATNPFIAPAGTAAAPAYAFTGEADCGLWVVGANQVGVATGGVNRLTIATASITSTLPIALPGNPANALEAAPKQYVDSVVGALSSTYVDVAGDTMSGALVISGSSTTDMLRITQTGTGNAFVVEDSANPDATPFAIDASGNVTTGGNISTVGNLTLTKTSPTIILDSAGNTNHFIYARADGVDKWLIAPGLANAAAQFTIYRYSDTAVQGVAFTMSRTANEAAFGGNPQVGTPLIVRSDGAAANEVGLVVQNSTALEDSAVDLRFQTGTGTNRARIRGQKETGTNTGKLVLSSFAAVGVEAEAVSIGSTKLTTFLTDSIQIQTAKTPASATATGLAGQVCWDSGFVYVCVAANSWKRAAIAAW